MNKRLFIFELEVGNTITGSTIIRFHEYRSLNWLKGFTALRGGYKASFLDNNKVYNLNEEELKEYLNN